MIGATKRVFEVVFFVVTLSRAQSIATVAGTYSIHRIAPELFGGYDETPGGAKLATPEKALFDFAYLSSTRSRLFVALPEVEIPPRFRHVELKRWIAKIPSTRARTITTRKLEQLLG